MNIIVIDYTVHYFTLDIWTCFFCY